jgi:predicted transcriptional regulator
MKSNWKKIGAHLNNLNFDLCERSLSGALPEYIVLKEDELQGRRPFELIVAKIAFICREGERKTKIMYGSMLNQKQLNRYLDLLTSNGLLLFNPKEKNYKSTEKGLRYLSKYAELLKNRNILDALEREIEKILPYQTSSHT